MGFYKLRNIDPDDISDWVEAIETTFDTRFADDAFADVSTFGQFCDRVKSLLTWPHDGRCTSQMAFYKLRRAFCQVTGTQTITPTTSLAALLPVDNRLDAAKQIEEHLGMKLNLLKPSAVVSTGLSWAALLSFAGLFYNWHVALPTLLLNALIFRLATAYGKSLTVNTFGELTHRLAQTNYITLRSGTATVNYNEVDKMLVDWASQVFDLDKKELHREARFS